MTGAMRMQYLYSYVHCISNACPGTTEADMVLLDLEKQL